MNNGDAIQKLGDLWYRCLIDHHKDRDCHWYIDKTRKWSYGQPEVNDGWCVRHHGYILDEIHEFFDSEPKAERGLIKILREVVRKEAERWLSPEGLADWNEENRPRIKTEMELVLSELRDIEAQLQRKTKPRTTGEKA